MRKILMISCLLLTLASCKKNVKQNDELLKQNPAEVRAVWSSCSNWAGWSTGKYYFRNNIWGSGNPGAGWQCVWANNESNWGANAGHQNNSGSVKGYPQMIVGWAQGNGFGLNADRGNMGQKHQAYNNLKVYWNFNAATNSTVRYLSLIDLYYHWSSNPDGNALPRTNIQIQTQWNDPSGWFDNTAPTTMTYKGQRTIDGIAYNMWYKSPHPDGAAENLIHVRPVTKTTNATHNVKEICAWAVSLGLMSNDEYQTSIQAGWEIIDGNNGVNFETKNYAVIAD